MAKNLPADYRQTFAANSKWFKHVDIPGTGLEAEMVATIEDVDTGFIGEGAKKKIQYILKFEGIEKPFGANRTNCDTLALLYGADPAAWIGRSVVMYRTTTVMAGETKQCVRFRNYVPAGAKRAAPHGKPAKSKRRAA